MPRVIESESEGEAEFNSDEEPEDVEEGSEEDEDEENEDDDDNEDDEDGEDASVDSDAPKKRKSAPKRPAKTSRASDTKRQKIATRNPRSSTAKAKTPKTLRKFDRLEDARKAYKWWEAEELPAGIQWRHLEHCGIVFPPSYTPHNIPLLYDGKEVVLTPEQEEIATFYAAIPEDGPQLGNPKTRPVFQKNFFVDFKASLPATSVIKRFDKCDFTAIREYLALQKSLRKAASEEEKTLKKLEKEDIQLRYGYALIDGRMEKVRLLLLFSFLTQCYCRWVIIIWSRQVYSVVEENILAQEPSSGAVSLSQLPLIARSTVHLHVWLSRDMRGKVFVMIQL